MLPDNSVTLAVSASCPPFMFVLESLCGAMHRVCGSGIPSTGLPGAHGPGERQRHSPDKDKEIHTFNPTEGAKGQRGGPRGLLWT